MDIHRRRLLCLPLVALAPVLSARGALPQGSGQLSVTDETWTHPQRQREIALRIRWPSPDAAAPPGGWTVVLFSHGLGGSRKGGAVWGEAWAKAGFVVIHLQHAGSDLNAVRSSGGRFSDPASLRRIGVGQQLLARVDDVRLVLDELERRHASGQSRWSSVRTRAVGLSGHSFGAHTTLAMAGQQFLSRAGIAEPRLAAFVALSPTLPARGDARLAFAGITRPMLCLTGNRDGDVAGTGAAPQRRMGVFDALPDGQKASLVLQDADHMTFAGQTGRPAEILPRETVTRDLQASHHSAIASITTEWWRAHLLGDERARQRLARPAGLSAGDVWQTG